MKNILALVILLTIAWVSFELVNSFQAAVIWFLFLIAHRKNFKQHRNG